MKITYGKSDLISFKYFFIIVVLITFFSEQIFNELVYGDLEGQEMPFNFEKFFLPLTVVVTVFSFFSLSKSLKYLSGLAIIYLVILVLESKVVYGSFFMYPHVFSKIMYVFVVFFSYVAFRNVERKQLKTIAFIIIVAFLADLFIHNRDVLSFSSFVQTERGFSASSTYLLLFAIMYFFNLYLERNTFFHLLIFLVGMGFIVFLQHRSVWISAAVVLIVNLIFISYKTDIKFASRLVTVGAVMGLASSLVVTFVLMDNPEVLNTLTDRFDDIQNYKSEGTGSWRYMQFTSYWPIVQEHIVFGMRLKGFELPIQFYHPDAGVPFFNDGSGHHFHSFYLDKLFYMGIIGLLITLAPLFYFFLLVFRKKELSIQEVFLSSFIASAVIYGISYNWPIIIYFFLGIGIAFIKQKKQQDELAPKEFNFDFHLRKEIVD